MLPAVYNFASVQPSILSKYVNRYSLSFSVTSKKLHNIKIMNCQATIITCI